jgi:chitinase
MVPLPRILAAVLIGVSATAVSVATPASAAGPGLTATFSSTDNGSWRMAKYVVANPTSASITGWTIEFDVPAGLTVGQGYNGTVTQTGSHVSVVNAFYNGTVAAGATTEPYSFWFIATGTNAAPANCRINGNKCDGSADRAPNAPTGVTVTGRTTKTASLSWAAATATDFPIASYQIVRSGSTTVATGTSGTVSGLAPNTTYSFTVRAVDTRGNVSPDSAAVSVTTLNPANDTTAPSVPGNVRVTAKTATSVSLSWNASTDASGIAGYEVSASGGGSLPTVGLFTGTTATITGLKPLTAYTFTVKARDTYDNVSPASVAASATTDDVIGAGNHAKVGYFVQWGIYGRQYFVKNLDTSGSAAKLTHLNYAFANVDLASGSCLQGVTRGTTTNPQDPNQGDGAGDADADYARPFAAAQSVDGVADTGWEPLRGNFNQLKKLKAKHPNLKILVSLGGWTYSKYFSDAAATAASRQALVSSCIDMFIKGNLPATNGRGGPSSGAGIFDGVDIDWEYPDPGTSGNNYTALMRQLSTTLHGQGKLLTAAVVSDGGTANGVQPAVFGYVDWLNIMAYDGGSPHANYDWSIASANFWKSRGLPANKTVLGVPFYSRPGYLTYAQLVALNSANANRDCTTANGAQQCYNGIPTIKRKTQWALANAGGIMNWELSQDTSGSTSLVSAVYAAATA